MPEIQVLEIGSGNGRMVPGVVAQAHGFETLESIHRERWCGKQNSSMRS